MADTEIMVKVKISWSIWVFPYLLLTRFGLWLGLPLDPEIIVKDMMRGLRVKVERKISG